MDATVSADDEQVLPNLIFSFILVFAELYE